MKKENCFYCTKNHELSDLMIKICDFENSTLYLFKDQRYPGRCVLAFHDHREELFELSEEEDDELQQIADEAKGKLFILLNHSQKLLLF